MERQKRNFLIAEIRQHLDGPLQEVIDFLTMTRDRCAEDGWENVSIDIDYEESYGCTTVEAELRGDRLETEEEADTRVNLAKRRLKAQEDNERKQFEQLKAKYG